MYQVIFWNDSKNCDPACRWLEDWEVDRKLNKYDNMIINTMFRYACDLRIDGNRITAILRNM